MYGIALYFDGTCGGVVLWWFGGGVVEVVVVWWWWGGIFGIVIPLPQKKILIDPFNKRLVLFNIVINQLSKLQGDHCSA